MNNKIVIVLDLDDTLYKEVDFIDSFIRYIQHWLEDTCNIKVPLTKEKAITAGEGDMLVGICKLAGLNISIKDSLLWMYRLHKPDISIPKSDLHCIKKWVEYHHVVILTDGRYVTQMNKIKALGLDGIPALISEQFNSEKPDLTRFKKIQKDFPNKAYLYIADNTSKDFLAPNILGWHTCGIIDDGRNIHKQNMKMNKKYLPEKWYTTLKSIRISDYY